MSLPGLHSYHADSEISDSEGETTPVHDPPPAPGVGKFRTTYLQHESLFLPLLTVCSVSLVSSGLGIPQSHPPQPSPPTFVRPVVHSAPSIGLVDYQGDEDDIDMEVEGPQDTEVSRELAINDITVSVSSLSLSLSLSTFVGCSNIGECTEYKK